MEFDEKAISFLKRAKEEGITKEEAFATLRTKGYDIPESQAPERLPEPPADMENYINQKSEEMPYEPIAYAQGNIDEANRQLAQIDELNKEYAPLVGGVEKNVKPEFGSPLLFKLLNMGTAGSKNPVQKIVNTATNPEITKPAAEMSRQVAYFALPGANLARGFKGAQLVNNLLSGVYQGGLVGGAENAFKGEDLIKGVKEGALLGGGVAGGFAAAPAIANLIGKPVGKTYSFANELLSGVPREYTERALQKEMAGQSIFKGKFDPMGKVDELGIRAQDAMNNLKRITGQATGQQRRALKSIPDNVDVAPVINKIDELITENTSRSGISRLDKSDVKEINEIKELLSSSAYVDDLDNILTKIQGLTKNDINRVKTTSDSGDYVLGKIGDEIQKMLPENFKTAKAGYKQAKDLQGRLKTKLKDTSINRTLQNIDSDANIRDGYNDLFRELDAISPDNLKFMDETEDLIARRAFEKIFPGRGGGSGSDQGYGNVLRLFGVGAVNPLLLPLTSPKVQGALGVQLPGAINQLLQSPQGQEYARKALVQSLLTAPASP